MDKIYLLSQMVLTKTPNSFYLHLSFSPPPPLSNLYLSSSLYLHSSDSDLKNFNFTIFNLRENPIQFRENRWVGNLMASSKVMASRSPPNPDLPRQPSSAPLDLNLQSDHTRGFCPKSMDNYFTGMYSDSTSFALENNGGGSGERVGVGSSAADGGGGEMRNGGANNMVDDVWRHLANGGGGGSVQPPMTLEDFMVKVGPGSGEVTRAPPPLTVGGFGIETVMMNHAAVVPAVQFSPAVSVRNGLGVDFGNGMGAVSGSVSGGARGKRRAAVEDVPLDKATQQKQRRMIKNRESAARSRERKQVPTLSLCFQIFSNLDFVVLCFKYYQLLNQVYLLLKVTKLEWFYLLIIFLVQRPIQWSWSHL